MIVGQLWLGWEGFWFNGVVPYLGCVGWLWCGVLWIWHWLYGTQYGNIIRLLFFQGEVLEHTWLHHMHQVIMDQSRVHGEVGAELVCYVALLDWLESFSFGLESRVLDGDSQLSLYF